MIVRRKIYPAELRDVLPRAYLLRQTADYKQDVVSETQAARVLRRARAFVTTIQQEGGDRT